MVLGCIACPGIVARDRRCGLAFTHQTLNTVRDKIDEAWAYHKFERCLLWFFLIVMFLTGVVLIVGGTIAQVKEAYLGGGASAGLMVIPMWRLSNLYTSMIALKVMLALIPTLNDQAAEQQVIRIMDTLVQQVKL